MQTCVCHCHAHILYNFIMLVQMFQYFSNFYYALICPLINLHFLLSHLSFVQATFSLPPKQNFSGMNDVGVMARGCYFTPRVVVINQSGIQSINI